MTGLCLWTCAVQGNNVATKEWRIIFEDRNPQFTLFLRDYFLPVQLSKHVTFIKTAFQIVYTNIYNKNTKSC